MAESLGLPAVAGASFTTPAGTTAYTAADLIADNASGASINPLAFQVAAVKDDTVAISRIRLKTNDSGFAGKTINLHLYRNKPTSSVGDNGAFGSGLAATESDKLDTISIALSSVATSDGYYKGYGVPTIGGLIITLTEADSKFIYGLLEAASAATPVGGKIWTCVLEVAGRR